MTRILSALIAAVSGVFTTKTTSDADLILWAKTEYSNDWRYAFQWMKEHPGSVPFNRPNIKNIAKQEKKLNDEYFGV